ncbi:MAG: DUF2330 domain-containing protein [Myxococcales bacterium]|nr:DUF2330 domain-containing protein [Myxococcales bacterium]
MLSSLLLSAWMQPAHACGGFFCNRDPIDQAGEDIIFAIDKDNGEVTVHVQIEYTGSADDFAWIVPVPQVPELVLSSDRLFQTVKAMTEPRFSLEIEELFDCEGGPYYGYYDAVADFSTTSASPPNAESGTVNVVSQQQVGPYDTVVLQAQTTAGLLDWLQSNGYLLPDELDPVLTPYVADDSYFVALKMAKDSEDGNLAPLAMRYAGDLASVPIQLTSIAATEDMRLRAYVFGDARAVPDSYHHVQVNDLVIDWFNFGNNWEDAITVAADEAGGHAFATDYSGPADILKDMLYRDGQYDIERLALATDPFRFFQEIQNQGFAGDATILALFQQFLPMPQELVDDGVDPQSFYNCLECYRKQVEQIPFDSAAFAAALDEFVVTPLRQAQEMVDAHSRLTRLTSSVSPVEMTVDPTFVFNSDMTQTVEQQRSATLQLLCGWGEPWQEAPRKLVLADGRVYELPSQQWFWENNLTEYEYLQDLMDVYALIIEDTSDEGEPLVIFDGTEDAIAAADDFNDPNQVAGCGCQSTAPTGMAASMLLALGLVVRRRRS